MSETVTDQPVAIGRTLLRLWAERLESALFDLYREEPNEARRGLVPLWAELTLVLELEDQRGGLSAAVQRARVEAAETANQGARP
jgi:hypothetical protein